MAEDQGLNATTPKSLQPFLDLSDEQKANAKIKTKEEHEAEEKKPEGEAEEWK